MAPACVQQHTAKYTKRPSPPFPANVCCRTGRAADAVKVGNDGRRYRAVAASNGVCRWQLDEQTKSRSSRSPARKATKAAKPKATARAASASRSKTKTQSKTVKRTRAASRSPAPVRKATTDPRSKYCRCLMHVRVKTTPAKPRTEKKNTKVQAENPYGICNKVLRKHKVKQPVCTYRFEDYPVSELLAYAKEKKLAAITPSLTQKRIVELLYAYQKAKRAEYKAKAAAKAKAKAQSKPDDKKKETRGKPKAKHAAKAKPKKSGLKADAKPKTRRAAK